ncbi:MAG: PhoU domain-containing protein [Gemmatimonadota bacterium]
MSHYEQRLEQDAQALRSGVAKVGKWVSENVADAVRALTTNDKVLANRTILRDRAVNRQIDDLDHLCHVFVIRHLPSAGHLRLVSSVLRVNVALERIGDYAVTACRELLQLSAPLPEGVAADIAILGDQAGAALRNAVEAFVTGDLSKAAQAEGMAKQVDPTFLKTYRDLTQAGDRDERQTRDLFSTLLAARVIKRVADQAENLCEQTQFQVTGESKGHKTYRILFFDERGALLSRMAQSFAEEAYPDTGRFRSAGYAPADHFDPGLLAFLQQRGVHVEGAPVALAKALDVPKHYHVIVGIGAKASNHIKDIPFRTVTLTWDLGTALQEAERVPETERYSALYRAVADHVTALMETLGVESHR